MNIEQYRALKAQEATRQAEQPTSQDTIKQDTPTQIETAAETKTEDKTTAEVVENKPKQSEEKASDKFFIEGVGEVTLDELKNGYLRQSDYTKKTQDIARQRNEHKDAISFYQFLKQNPKVAQKVIETTKGAIPQTIDPTQAKVIELQNKVYDMMLEMEISKLQSKYEDFDVREVLQVAQSKGLTNLEDAYKLVKAGKPVKDTSVDLQTLKEQMREEILREIEKENKETRTIITAKNGGNKVISDNSPRISETEKLVAKKMGMSETEYVKWRDIDKRKK